MVEWWSVGLVEDFEKVILEIQIDNSIADLYQRCVWLQIPCLWIGKQHSRLLSAILLVEWRLGETPRPVSRV